MALPRWAFVQRSIQNKMLVMILPLVVVPMLTLALVGFWAASREAAKSSSRYLKQRENDLRTIAENNVIQDYFYNQLYGLTEETNVYRLELEADFEPVEGLLQVTNRGTREIGPTFVVGQVFANGLFGGRTRLGAAVAAAGDYDEYHSASLLASWPLILPLSR